MKNFFSKIRSNKSGFTLTEVMIGIMVLTVAIVSATNILVGLISSNKNIVSHLQAYYLAQEGLEGVRNLRDTMWLNNVSMKSQFKEGAYTNGTYKIFLKREGWSSGAMTFSNFDALIGDKWKFEKVSLPAEREETRLCVQKDGDKHFYGECLFASSVESKSAYYRYVEISDYCENVFAAVVTDESKDICKNSVLVKSVVSFDQDKEVVLEEVLTDWKGGVL